MKTLEELGISPAPWKTSSYGVCVDDTNGNSVATTDNDDDATNRADSRLIAAAPELYEALREAVIEMCHGCDHYQMENRRKCSRSDGECFVQKWRAALAKAGGAE